MSTFHKALTYAGGAIKASFKRGICYLKQIAGDRLAVSRLIAAVLSCHPSDETSACSLRGRSILHLPIYADDSWMVDERLWWKDYDKKPNPKNRLSAGGDTSSACADVRSIPVFFAMPRPSAYSLLALDIHQYPPPPINPFWISHCLSFEPPLWRPTQLHLPTTLMAFSHIRQLIKSKFQWWINVAPADAPKRFLLLSINVLPERLCPAGMYDIMRSIQWPSWVTRPPIAHSQFFFWP